MRHFNTSTNFFLALIFFCSASTCLLQAQVDSVYYGRKPDSVRAEPKKRIFDGEWKEKFNWGGNFQAWVGNPTFIYLSPTVGYLPFKNLNVGLGLIYNYTNIRTYYGDYSQSIFGAHSYARYIIAESYFVQVQFDKLRQPDLLSLKPEKKIWIDYVLVGGGFRQSLGDKAALTSSIMYNLTPHPLSIYPGRIIVQFGIVVGF